MKILHIIPSYKPAYIYGGPIRSVSNLCESLVRSGHEVTVFTTTANGKVELDVYANQVYTIGGVKVNYFKRWTHDHSNISPRLIGNVYRNCKNYDVIHIQSWWNFIALSSTLICILRGIQPIVSTRGSITKFTFEHSRSTVKRLIHSLIGRWLLDRAIIHVTSIREETELVKFCTGKKISVIPNLLELPGMIYGVPKMNGILKLIFVGRIDPAKNLEFILKVLTDHITIPFHFNIIGDGNTEYVQKLKHLTLRQPGIFWHGEKDGEYKFRMIAESDLFVLPSLTENFGNVVIEALSQGTPVLISQGVGAKDIVTENNLGWVIDFSEVNWAKAINDVWSKPEALLEIRKRAPGIIARQFNPERQVDEYINMYKEVMEGANE